MRREEMGGETKWKSLCPQPVKGRAIVKIIVIRAMRSKIKLGRFVLKKTREVLMENIRKISVKMLSINQRVWSKDGSTLWKMIKKVKSKTVLTDAKRTMSGIKLCSLYNLGFFNSSTSTLSEATAIKGKSERRLTNKIWMGSIGKKGINKEMPAIE